MNNKKSRWNKIYNEMGKLVGMLLIVATCFVPPYADNNYGHLWHLGLIAVLGITGTCVICHFFNRDLS